MAAVHVIGAGSDAGSVWLRVPLALTIAIALTLLGHRLLGERHARAPRRAPATRAAAAPAPAHAPDEAPTTAVPAPLWARHTSGPPRD
jgi:hypothetical protein